MNMCCNMYWNYKEKCKMENNYVYPAYLKEEDGDKYLVFPDFEELVVGIEDDIDFIQEAQTELALVIIGYLDEGRELPKRSEFDKDAITVIDNGTIKEHNYL